MFKVIIRFEYDVSEGGGGAGRLWSGFSTVQDDGLFVQINLHRMFRIQTRHAGRASSNNPKGLYVSGRHNSIHFLTFRIIHVYCALIRGHM